MVKKKTCQVRLRQAAPFGLYKIMSRADELFYGEKDLYLCIKKKKRNANLPSEAWEYHPHHQNHPSRTTLQTLAFLPPLLQDKTETVGVRD